MAVLSNRVRARLVGCGPDPSRPFDTVPRDNSNHTKHELARIYRLMLQDLEIQIEQFPNPLSLLLLWIVTAVAGSSSMVVAVVVAGMARLDRDVAAFVVAVLLDRLDVLWMTRIAAKDFGGECERVL